MNRIYIKMHPDSGDEASSSVHKFFIINFCFFIVEFFQFVKTFDNFRQIASGSRRIRFSKIEDFV